MATGDTNLTNLVLSGGATIAGDLTVTGGITGSEGVQVLADDGAITLDSGIVILTKATASAITLAAPTSNGRRLTIVSTTAAAHTITATTIGFNAGNAASDVATLGGAIGDGLEVVSYEGEWYVTGNTNATLA